MKNNSIITKKLRSIVNEEIIKEVEEMQKRKAVHAIIVDITKAGSDGMKAMKSVRAKKMPTAKATSAVQTHIDALRAIYADMLRNPTNYLDRDPKSVVDSRMNDLDDRDNNVGQSEDDVTL